MRYPFQRIIRDLQNYAFLRKTIKENKGSVEWEGFKLRADWIGRIYTVINLPPEVMHSPDAPEEIRPAFIIEESKPLNLYLTKLNLSEILIPEIGPIPDSISYLILYKPYFLRLSWKWVILRILLIASIIVLNVQFGIFPAIIALLNKWYGVIF